MGAAENIPDDWLAVDAEYIAPMFGVSARQIVDRLSKQPGFPQPTSRRPLRWPLGKVREYQASLTSPRVRRA